MARVVFLVDGLLSLCFGLATAMFQARIFSTAVDLPSAGFTGDGHSLIESALLTLSGYYVLAGAVLVLLSRVPKEFAVRLAGVVALHHAFMVVKGVAEAHRPWATGNPWWDVAIHCAFITAYAVVLLRARSAPALAPR